ncbi:metalloregulator ArsR/SmtB family transcription factor [Sorangium sp. So ce136]|uniref:ArsR/SmtB family transcription factor n=1 Tax=Sorangium sp. So ce136 TaxID=3133284 RepID=UPI003F03058F
MTGIYPIGHILLVMVETFAALADPTRLRIVELLRAGPRPVGEISDRLPLPQPQVSKHLRVLRDAGLVDVRPQAQQRIYGLRAGPLRELNEWIERFRCIWDARFEQLDDLLAEIQRNEEEEKR